MTVKQTDAPPSSLHQWLVSLVKDSRRSQADLAFEAHLSQKHVSDMLTGKADGSLEAWSRLLDAAGVHLPGEELASVHPIGDHYRAGLGGGQ